MDIDRTVKPKTSFSDKLSNAGSKISRTTKKLVVHHPVDYARNNQTDHDGKHAFHASMTRSPYKGEDRKELLQKEKQLFGFEHSDGSYSYSSSPKDAAEERQILQISHEISSPNKKEKDSDTASTTSSNTITSNSSYSSSVTSDTTTISDPHSELIEDKANAYKEYKQDKAKTLVNGYIDALNARSMKSGSSLKMSGFVGGNVDLPIDGFRALGKPIDAARKADAERKLVDFYATASSELKTQITAQLDEALKATTKFQIDGSEHRDEKLGAKIEAVKEKFQRIDSTPTGNDHDRLTLATAKKTGNIDSISNIATKETAQHLLDTVYGKPQSEFSLRTMSRTTYRSLEYMTDKVELFTTQMKGFESEIQKNQDTLVGLKSQLENILIDLKDEKSVHRDERDHDKISDLKTQRDELKAQIKTLENVVKKDKNQLKKLGQSKEKNLKKIAQEVNPTNFQREQAKFGSVTRRTLSGIATARAMQDERITEEKIDKPKLNIRSWDSIKEYASFKLSKTETSSLKNNKHYIRAVRQDAIKKAFGALGADLKECQDMLQTSGMQEQLSIGINNFKKFHEAAQKASLLHIHGQEGKVFETKGHFTRDNEAVSYLDRKLFGSSPDVDSILLRRSIGEALEGKTLHLNMPLTKNRREFTVSYDNKTNQFNVELKAKHNASDDLTDTEKEEVQAEILKKAIGLLNDTNFNVNFNRKLLDETINTPLADHQDAPYMQAVNDMLQTHDRRYILKYMHAEVQALKQQGKAPDELLAALDIPNPNIATRILQRTSVSGEQERWNVENKDILAALPRLLAVKAKYQPQMQKFADQNVTPTLEKLTDALKAEPEKRADIIADELHKHFGSEHKNTSVSSHQTKMERHIIKQVLTSLAHSPDMDSYDEDELKRTSKLLGKKNINEADIERIASFISERISKQLKETSPSANDDDQETTALLSKEDKTETLTVNDLSFKMNKAYVDNRHLLISSDYSDLLKEETKSFTPLHKREQKMAHLIRATASEGDKNVNPDTDKLEARLQEHDTLAFGLNHTNSAITASKAGAIIGVAASNFMTTPVAGALLNTPLAPIAVLDFAIPVFGPVGLSLNAIVSIAGNIVGGTLGAVPSGMARGMRNIESENWTKDEMTRIALKGAIGQMADNNPVIASLDEHSTKKGLAKVILSNLNEDQLKTLFTEDALNDVIDFAKEGQFRDKFIEFKDILTNPFSGESEIKDTLNNLLKMTSEGELKSIIPLDDVNVKRFVLSQSVDELSTLDLKEVRGEEKKKKEKLFSPFTSHDVSSTVKAVLSNVYSDQQDKLKTELEKQEKSVNSFLADYMKNNNIKDKSELSAEHTNGILEYFKVHYGIGADVVKGLGEALIDLPRTASNMGQAAYFEALKPLLKYTLLTTSEAKKSIDRLESNDLMTPNKLNDAFNDFVRNYAPDGGAHKFMIQSDEKTDIFQDKTLSNYDRDSVLLQMAKSFKLGSSQQKKLKEMIQQEYNFTFEGNGTAEKPPVTLKTYCMAMKEIIAEYHQELGINFKTDTNK